MNGIVNSYSPRWFEVFGDTVDPDQTRREVDFIMRQLPAGAGQRVLDMPCGSGRHARLLAQRGCLVAAVDRDGGCIERARAAGGANVTYSVGDMRHIELLPVSGVGSGGGEFDGVICLWQSFGMFDDATNARVLRGMVSRLRAGGRLILDVYHRRFFEEHQGRRWLDRGPHSVTETKSMHGDRLHVRLDYAGGEADVFDWRLYAMDEWHELAREASLSIKLCCALFDEARPATPREPRMQLVVHRP